MLRSRVTTSIDMGRLSNAVSRPGIDPRVWVSYAVLTSAPYLETVDGEQDIVVDIQLMPTGEEETARVGAIYAGNGFGLYAPLYEGDEVLICAPSGDPDEGLVVMQRLWSPAAVPPQAVYDNPEDVTLVVKEGQNLRLKMLGAGTTYITAEDGKVVLGEETATRGVARLDDTTVNGTLTLTATAVPPVPPAPPGVILTLSYLPPDAVLPVTSTVTLAVATLVSAIGSIDLTGKIDSASEKVVSS